MSRQRAISAFGSGTGPMQGIPLVDVQSAMQQYADEGLFFKDGVQMNDNGHKLVADLVRPAVMKLLDEAIPVN